MFEYFTFFWPLILRGIAKVGYWTTAEIQGTTICRKNDFDDIRIEYITATGWLLCMLQSVILVVAWRPLRVTGDGTLIRSSSKIDG